MPGMETSIDEAHLILSQMWEAIPIGKQGTKPPRASQMNVILHLDAETKLTEAQTCFETLLKLGKNHPCRAIILCPKKNFKENDILKSKIFSQCYLDAQHQSALSCEILILRYGQQDTQFLEHLISTWIENDLPTYYWLYKVSNKHLYNCYLPLLKRCWGIVYDSAIEGYNYTHIPWPHPQAVCDLAQIRILSIRQMVGKFVSIYDPLILVDSLKSIQMHYDPDFLSEANAFLQWNKSCLKKCFPNANTIETVDFKAIPISNESHTLQINWNYSNGNSFVFTFSKKEKTAKIIAKFNQKINTYSSNINLLDPAQSLSEAFFKHKNIDQ